MARTARFLALATLAVLPSLARANDIVTFPAGSLIIPMQGNFQDKCGTTSAYGLVWRILQSNQAGHFNAAHPVTVYWIINDKKGSPNRCVPSNLSANSDKGAWDSNPVWNDGCDTSIANTDHEPVVPVDYSADWPSANNGIYQYGAIPMFDSTGYPSSPSLPAEALDEATNPKFTTIQYLGGPFVIAKKDAQNVITFLQKGDDPYTSLGKGLEGALSRFTTPCTCAFNNEPPEGTNSDSRCNYVQMHQATISFDAKVGRRMSNVPPKIALLAGFGQSDQRHG